jgi:hypothetical protein
MIMERAVFVADIDRLPPPDEAYDRLYLGSEFCPWCLPGERELREALAAAACRGLTFSLVTPFLDEPGLVRTLALVRALPQDPATEVVANDLGLIEALRAAGWAGTLVAGRLLMRQRRGPGFQSFGDVPPEAAAALRGSALDSPDFVELLGSVYGVKRFELDDLVQGVSVPALPAGVSLSLYRPYLLVTATRNCPWVFDGQTWDRSHGCARPCRGHALRLVPVQAAGFRRYGPSSTGGCRAGINPAPTTKRTNAGEGFKTTNSANEGKGFKTANSANAGEGFRTTNSANAGEGFKTANSANAGEGFKTTDSANAGEGFKTTDSANVGEGFTPSRAGDDSFSAIRVGGPQRQDHAAPNGTRELLLGGCAQFLEHRSEAPLPASVDRIVWQPGIPA